MTDAQQAEATESTITFTYDGEDYTFDPGTFTLDMIEADEAGKTLTVVRTILGEEQYQAYKARHPLASDLGEFRLALINAMGNSEASPSS